ncbi:MAG: tRNA (guanosine(37)-N1)-methyltransferase TrmD [Planctomycetota bacterium]
MSEEKKQETLRIDLLTLFPEVFPLLLQSSILGIGAEKGLVDYHLHDVRNYTEDKHGKVDDRPYGGGPGMVIQCQPVFDACEKVENRDPQTSRLIMMSPQGQPLNQQLAGDLAQSSRLMLLCGHYEGFDERIRSGLEPEEISVGDYVLSSGEVAAMVLIDATVRLLPGVLGHEDSTADESFADGRLEYPQYTRPENFRGMKVPEVLRSGNHGKIAEWRDRMADTRTKRRRSDLLKNSDVEQTNG